MWIVSKTGTFDHIDDPLIRADLLSETIGGGTNAVAALGNGALTVGVSPWSEIVYLRWPTPSFYDHLRYVTLSRGLLTGLSVRDARHGRDAPCRDWERYGRPHDKHKGLGAKAGIYLESGELFWMDDPVWDSSRCYEPEGSSVLITELKNNENLKDHPVTVNVKQWVSPFADLFVQSFQVSCAAAARLFFHATFAPWKKMERGLGNKDSRKAGFASIHCPDEALLFWFSPERRDSQRLMTRLDQAMTPALLDEIYPEGGVFIALGSLQEIHQVQIGADRAGRRAKPGVPLGAREDAKDGTLQGNPFHMGPVDAGVGIDLHRSGCSVELLISVAGSAQKAAHIIKEARGKGAERMEQEAVGFWGDVSKKVFVPETAGRTEKRVARRSVLNLLTGHDKSSGAFVASPARQPHYCCDWPRDGVFYDMALDLAGLSDHVDAHLAFYCRTQRREKVAFSPTWIASFRSPFFFPRGHWYSNMNTDGSPGFCALIPIEIDETSLLVWDFWRHARYVSDDRKDQYRGAYQDMLILAVEAILRFVDLKKGWTRKVMEDDDFRIKATLHGAAAVLTALASAADLGTQWGIQQGKVRRWREAAVVLREGMLKRIPDPRVLDDVGWRGLPWSLFPAPLFDDYSHPASRAIIDRLARDMEEKISRQKGGVGYLGEQLFALAMSTKGMNEYQDLKERAIKLLTEDAPVPGTDCYGEVGLWKNLEDPSEFIIQNRTAIPHLWSGITVYLAVLAMHRPDLLQPLRPPIP